MSVYLVGAGPGAPDLVTVRAREVLARADVVVHDRLVDPRVLALAPWAYFIDVGKSPGRGPSQETINQLLCDLAPRHTCVVRLKGGDPFVFGRGGEEVRALRGAGYDVTVVAGISSALAAPLEAGISITERTLSQAVTIVTGRSSREGVDFRRLAQPGVTLVILMGVQRRGEIASELIEGGLAAHTAVAVIERASHEDQRVQRVTLASLGAAAVESPAVIVVGEVCDEAALARVALSEWS